MTNRMSHYKKDDIIACKIWPCTKYGHAQNMAITKNKPQYLVGKDYI